MVENSKFFYLIFLTTCSVYGKLLITSIWIDKLCNFSYNFIIEVMGNEG